MLCGKLWEPCICLQPTSLLGYLQILLLKCLVVGTVVRNYSWRLKISIRVVLNSYTQIRNLRPGSQFLSQNHKHSIRSTVAILLRRILLGLMVSRLHSVFTARWSPWPLQCPKDGKRLESWCRLLGNPGSLWPCFWEQPQAALTAPCCLEAEVSSWPWSAAFLVLIPLIGCSIKSPGCCCWWGAIYSWEDGKD